MKKLILFISVFCSLLFVVSCNRVQDEVVEYKVVFASNGGTILDDVIIKDGIKFNEPVAPTKEGYEFGGWYTDYDLTKPYDFSLQVESDLILYAKWIPLEIKCSVIFVSNDGTYIAPIIVIKGSKLNLPENPKKNGYTFDAWYLDEELTIEFDVDSSIESDIILYAGYEKIKIPSKFSVNFEANCDEVISSITVTEGDTITVPSLKERDGYEFSGWYVDSNFKIQFNVDDVILENTTLYAKWDLIYYTISFETNEGSIVDDVIVSAIDIPSRPADPTRDGHTFVGWYSDKLLSEKFNFDSVINQDVTLYAKWKVQIPPSTDATLKELYVNGIIVSNFSKDVYEYEINLTTGATTFIVSATANDSRSKIEGADTYDIIAGNIKVINIVVTAEDGTKLTYKIKVISPVGGTELEFIYCAGLSEEIALTFIDSNYKEAKAYYRKSGTSVYTLVDSNLITLENKVPRVDILGLSSGTYDVKVVTGSGDIITKDGVVVTAHDRSGYAFFDTNDNSIGAYNEDGTLKSNADVVYVTNETKNTVTYNGKTGLVAILKSLSNINKPVCIRIIGTITTNQFEEKSDAPRLADGSNYDEEGLVAFYTNTYSTEYGENLVGLTSKITMQGYKVITHTTTKDGSTYKVEDRTSSSTTTYSRSDYSEITGKKVFDDDSSYNMVNVTTTSGLTLEGIGTQAEIFQWGINFSKSCNVEVRNLTFTNAPEDACSFSGGSNSDNNYYGVWVHNNTFNKGYNSWDITGERDKANGDGAIDLRFVHGITLSYNKFNGTHKTGLVGGSNSNMQYNITFHHNYYYNVSSRLPLGRQANMHIYNNYYYNCSSTLDIRANAYVLSEGNYFENSRLPKVEVYEDGSIISAVKSIGDVFVDTKGDVQVTIVSSRDTLVDNTCTYGSSFDTSTNLFYYDSVNKKSDVMILSEANQAKDDCINYAGVLKENQEDGININ